MVVLDAVTGNETWAQKVPNADQFTRVRFSPDSSRVVTRTREAVQVWNAADGKQVTTFPVLPGQYLLAVSDEARLVDDPFGLSFGGAFGRALESAAERVDPAFFGRAARLQEERFAGVLWLQLRTRALDRVLEDFVHAVHPSSVACAAIGRTR